jgi:hypothetical protein
LSGRLDFSFTEEFEEAHTVIGFADIPIANWTRHDTIYIRKTLNSVLQIEPFFVICH